MLVLSGWWRVCQCIMDVDQQVVYNMRCLNAKTGVADIGVINRNLLKRVR
jgi:hypothetical protein